MTMTRTLATAILATAFSTAALADDGKPAPTKAERVARGSYLVNAVGCADCHTPLKMGPKGPERDMTRFLSGHPAAMVMPPAPVLPPGPWAGAAGATLTAWSGPWGTSFTANLTPDKETGLGGWTARNFIETIRNARHQGRGRPLLPPMPVEFYKNFTDEDLESIFAYLQSIPPVKNRVPQPIPPPAVTAAK
jgi:mono/diheme cytochrome c family protein